MSDRYPLIINSTNNQIEELSFGDNLNLSGSSIVNAEEIFAQDFIGNLVGIASTALFLSNAANILAGTISSERLSGNYNINVSTADVATALQSANNILTGTISSERLSGTYNITANQANNLTNAANITTGTINAARLSGSYNINITGIANQSDTSTNVIGGISSVTQSRVSGISSVGAGITMYASTGVINATSYYGNGVNLVGIVTNLIPGIGIDLTPTQTPGNKGQVTITSYKPIGKTIYVSQNGNDSNTGLAENHPKRTIKNAAGVATYGDTIKVFPGVYVEDNPIILNKSVSIEGTELRNCLITPQNPGLDLFYVNNSCHLTDLSFVGQSATNQAAIISFQPLAGVSSDRFFDGARMIRMNLDFIASETVGYLTSTNYKNPAFVVPTGNPNDCKDDIKNIFKAVCFDITRGGNSKSVGAGKSYYTSGGALQHITGTDINGYSVKQATIDALKYSVGIAFSCVNNVLWTGNNQSAYTQVRDLSIQPDGISNSDIGNCSNVLSAINSCVGIVTTIIGNGLSALGGAGINTNYPYDYDGQVGNNWSSTKIGLTTYSPGVGPITQGPYIRNCTNFIPNTIGMRVDGFHAEPGDQDDIGVTGSMSVDSFTQYNQGGIGVSITNGAYSQLVSIFTICTDIGHWTAGGGQCDLTNSNCSFGNKALVSSGVGDSNSRSIYRYTGTVVNTVDVDGENRDTVVVSGVGNQRPYDGQAIYFDTLYYEVQRIEVTDGGSGYVTPPIVTIDNPTGPNGIRAEASANIENGKVVSVDIISSGNQYLPTPNVSFSGGGGVGATATAIMYPLYYGIERATLPVAGISTIVLQQNLNNTISAGSTVYFSRLSLQLATTIALEWVGSGTDINTAKPSLGGVTKTENEFVMLDGGKIVFTGTNQSGNFRIGPDLTVNQLTGTISGRAFSQSLLNTVTPLIIALGK
jgi:hypothetical protein